MAQAQMMASNGLTSAFPVPVNDLVLEKLNKFCGTPQGRTWFHDSLNRMTAYQPGIRKALTDHKFPQELLAVPLIESGYQNMLPSSGHGVGAGIWMFLESTARHYGLRVDQQVDERLDPVRETSATMAYLTEMNQQFDGDWGLTVLAFNAGSAAVEQAIDETHSRDVWTLIRQGHENDPGYLASVVAAAIIIKSPDCLN